MLKIVITTLMLSTVTFPASRDSAADFSQGHAAESDIKRAMATMNVDTLKAVLPAVASVLSQRKDTTSADYYSLACEYAILCHNFAVRGAKKGYRGFAKKSYTRFRRMLGDPSFPDSLKPVAQAYSGSARVLMGEEDANPVNKLKYVNEGIAILDRAVAAYDRISYVPRFMRANVFIELPAIFKKRAVALGDYEYLEECYRSSAEKPDEGIMAYVYLNLGKACRKKNDMEKAVDYWEKAIAAAPGGDAAQSARKMIALSGE